MYKKLLKKIAVYVMAAVLCAGMFVPMQVEAASWTFKDLAGTWEGGPWGENVVIEEDGMITDCMNSRQGYMQSGTVEVTYYGTNSKETVSYDMWRGETAPTSLSDDQDATIYEIGDENIIRWWNISKESGTVYAYSPSVMTRAAAKKSKSHKENPEEVAKRKAEEAKKEEERKALEAASKEAARMAEEAAEKGFADMAQMQEAQAGGKSADEYYNNAVVNTEGIEDATPISQGGGLIINGEKTNVTATISKVSSFYVNSVRAAREGTVLNVVDVQFPAKEAVASFYMPGVAQGDAITAAQYIDGAWTDVEVTEVRADHVVLNLKNNGIVAFLKN